MSRLFKYLNVGRYVRRILQHCKAWIHTELTFTPYPLSGILKVVDGWVANGIDPALLLNSDNAVMPIGWYKLNLAISSDFPYQSVKLYPDYGKGFHESDSFFLLAPKGEVATRVCYFHRVPKRLRLDPCEQACSFSLSELALSKLSTNEAARIMSQTLRIEFGCQVPVVLSSAKLWREYNSNYQKLASSQHAIAYQQWLKLYDVKVEPEALQQCLYQPLISVVLPVWNTSEELLRCCINSVLAQHYTNWQLCIADDASTLPHVKHLLQEYVAQDPRIEVQYRQLNGHICKASNTALEMARGDFVALLDHDDELHSCALAEVVLALNDRPDLDVLYTDEDFLDSDGNRQSPHFKSDWNPELLKSQNYVTHLCVYRCELLQSVGGFREGVGVEGAQDYDLLLRCSSQTSPERIYHIPKVLYHWRMHDGSTALSSSEKVYTIKAGRKALQDHLDSNGQIASVELACTDNYYRVVYPLSGEPLISLLVPTRDNLEILQPCIESILNKTTYKNFEVLILDNQSQEPETLKWFKNIERHPRVRVLPFDQPFNYSSINNYGAEQAKGEVIGLINNDVEVITPDWLSEMVSLVIQPQNGCVGAKLYYPDGSIQHGGIILGLGGYAAHSHRGLDGESPGYFNRLRVRQNLSAVTGACLLVRKEVWHQLGGLEEELSVAYNDVDFCLRARRAGYLNLFTPFAELFHHESKSRGEDATPEKVARFEREKAFLLERWGESLKLDPYYNPNLTHNREDFSLNLG